MGAYGQPQPLMPRQTELLSQAVLVTGFPYDKHKNPNNNLREFNALLPRVRGLRRLGAAALDLAYVAAGRLDGYWEHNLSPWDIAAGALIVTEAGGTLTHKDGSPFELKPTGLHNLIATGGPLHEELQAALV